MTYHLLNLVPALVVVVMRLVDVMTAPAGALGPFMYRVRLSQHRVGVTPHPVGDTQHF
jgi:hypothetical protein